MRLRVIWAPPFVEKDPWTKKRMARNRAVWRGIKSTTLERIGVVAASVSGFVLLLERGRRRPMIIGTPLGDGSEYRLTCDRNGRTTRKILGVTPTNVNQKLRELLQLRKNH